MTRIGEHAVVLGAGIAGLITARVLADAYRSVAVYDRDAVPPIGAHRRGVPQAWHVHGLHPRGRQVLDEFFPGLTARLVEQGAVTGDALGDSRWQLSGHQLGQVDIGLPVLMASRPFLEGHVRAQVSALPNVTIVECTDVVGLTTTADRRRVTGVRVHGNVAGGERAVPADLVVDATGRGSRTPLWLSELGYPQPAVDRVDIGIGYATRLYRLRSGALGTDIAIATGGTPTNPRGGALVAIEGGRHMLTLHGILGDHPPTDPAGFEAFAATLQFPDISNALRGAEPVTNPVQFRFPTSVRHRYEQLRRFPAALLLIGDAVCSFNPVYGQGMTVAAMQALALRRHIGAGTARTPSRFFKDIAAVIDIPWDIAVGADLAFPQVPGPRSAKVRFVNAYLPRLHAAAAGDGELALAMIRVIGLKDRPEGLLRPDRVLRVLRGHLRRPARPGDAASPRSGTPAAL
jgi:2-polyprenyl-6-methoxyphenol hydroxylase-like FAD-dependent oxidoreductase